MIKRLLYLEIAVRNLQKSIDWYSKILGFEVCRRIENEDGPWCQMKTGSDDSLALWQDPNGVPAQEHPNQQTFFPIFQVDNLPQVVQELSAKEANILEPIRERKGYKITTIADPDGNKLQLVEVTH